MPNQPDLLPCQCGEDAILLPDNLVTCGADNCPNSITAFTVKDWNRRNTRTPSQQPIPTPRTDAAIQEETVTGSTVLPPHRKTYRTFQYVDVKFARQLERDLIAMTKVADELVEVLQKVSDHLDYCGYGDNYERAITQYNQLKGKLRTTTKKKGKI